MKKLIIVLGIVGLLLFSSMMITTAADMPTVNLPSSDIDVRMTAKYGIDSYFEMMLTLPSGYDVTNGSYAGWCVELDVNMTRNVNHQVRLYSSYDPSLPVEFRNDNWGKINYMINNKHGGNRNNIQEVVWYFCCDSPAEDLKEQEIIADANAHPDFIPTYGQKIAILAEVIPDGNYSVQRTFLELRLPPLVTLGDFVWWDYNANGIQDLNEPGFPGVTVTLYTQSGVEIDSTTTNSQGYYSFSFFEAGDYYIKFNLPSGHRFSPKDQGSNDLKDSDADPSTGRTEITYFTATQNDSSWDAGIYKVDEGGEPEPPATPGNYAPTADGTAGEPYDADVGEEIRFDGSRSYDRDGTIVSWSWSFGDGTTANGINVTHNYSAEGGYQVYLTVTDDDGATDTYQTVAHIGPNRPPLTPTVTGPSEGRRTIDYAFDVITTDPDHDDIRYIIQWGDESQYNSYFVKSGKSIQVVHAWNTSGVYTVEVYAQDTNNQTSEYYQKLIAIDARYIGNFGYLINDDITEGYDTFYSNSTGILNTPQRQDNGHYLIDTNNDGTFDYDYDPATRTYTETSGALNQIYSLLIAGIIIAIVVLLLLWFLAKRKKNKT